MPSNRCESSRPTQVVVDNLWTINTHSDFDAKRGQDIQRLGWQNRAVGQFKLNPVRPPGISLTSLPDLLESIGRSYPLITIHPEKVKPDVCYIGPLLSIAKATFTIDDLDCNAEWSGPRRLRFSDVTRVDFGGGYEEALAATAPKRPKRKK